MFFPKTITRLVLKTFVILTVYNLKNISYYAISYNYTQKDGVELDLKRKLVILHTKKVKQNHTYTFNNSILIL